MTMAETSVSVGFPDAQNGVISLNSSEIWLKSHFLTFCPFLVSLLSLSLSTHTHTHVLQLFCFLLSNLLCVLDEVFQTSRLGLSIIFYLYGDCIFFLGILPAIVS